MTTRAMIAIASAVVTLGFLLLPQLAIAAGLTEYKLSASDKASFDGFGVSVSVSGDLAWVGALESDDSGIDSGSGRRCQWLQY